MQFVAVSCSVLQWLEWSTCQFKALPSRGYGVLQNVAVCCGMLQCVTLYCIVWKINESMALFLIDFKNKNKTHALRHFFDFPHYFFSPKVIFLEEAHHIFRSWRMSFLPPNSLLFLFIFFQRLSFWKKHTTFLNLDECLFCLPIFFCS